MKRRLPPKGRKPPQKKPPPKKKVKCIACGDTGKNSLGNSCYPCTIQGRIK